MGGRSHAIATLASGAMMAAAIYYVSPSSENFPYALGYLATLAVNPVNTVLPRKKPQKWLFWRPVFAGMAVSDTLHNRYGINLCEKEAAMLFQFVCEGCGEKKEVCSTIGSPPVMSEPCACGGKLRRVFLAPAVTYRCSGFYATDKALYNPPDD